MAIVSTGQIYLSDTSDGISLQLSPPSINIPANSAGSIVAGTYTSTLSIYIGATNDSANWAYSVALGTGVTGSIGAATGILSVTALSQDTSYVDITAKKFGYSDQTIRCVVAKVRAGADGATSTVPGPTGQSNHRVYIATANSATPPATPNNTTSGGTPTSPATWSATPVTVTGVQAQWQSDGVTPAGSTTTTWGTPYLSYFKVGSLSAISADLGTITAGSLTIGTSPTVSNNTMTGSGATIATNGNFALGNSTTNISFNGTTMTLNGNVVASGNIQTGAVGTLALSANAVTDSASTSAVGATSLIDNVSTTITVPSGIFYFIIWADSGAYVRSYGAYAPGVDGPEYSSNFKAYEAPLYTVTVKIGAAAASTIIPTTGGASAKAAAPSQYVYISPAAGSYLVTLTRSIADGVTADSAFWAPPSLKWLMLKK